MKTVENYYKFQSDYQLTNDEIDAWVHFLNYQPPKGDSRYLDVYTFFTNLKFKRTSKRKAKDPVYNHLMDCMRNVFTKILC